MTWRTLAEPTYAVSRFGRAVKFPAGTVIRTLNPPTDEPFPGEIRVVAPKGSPFEDERPQTVVRPDGTSPQPVAVPALWWVTEAALRFGPDPCGQCHHVKTSHQLYAEPGDEEPWSWCDECGGQCEFESEGGAQAALAERLGFQPIQSRTHGYNGQEHR